jgi:hypothetical protein
MILPRATQNVGCAISAWNWEKNAEIVAGSKICITQFTAFSPRPVAVPGGDRAPLFLN